MAVDNTSLNLGQGGDTVRDLARQGGNVKTQTVQLDLGGASANAEVLITAGRQLMSASVPVVLASDQPALAVSGTFFQATQPVSVAGTVQVSVSNAPTTNGTWSYDAGVSGTLTVAASKRVLQITATAGVTAATVTINGGATITIPVSSSITIEPRGALVAPTIVFTNTVAYFVEGVT